ncbi:FAD-dependent oxidoreductase [Halomonas heilongjiangensis]|uniref:FAD-dependent oxidoreductase n=1 Tax=Halomonas heilongjiangensis TaxID=1387883 RepID=A0A2N7TND0_9GAMM|nr:FAD-dependent oxidoreductase [Halomonas heilongjiangensis]PMR69701.1 FAD-dependent oxidoreductase [Halomonas heilongjiangensis]PXX93089.1 FAD-dependent oxidoreductase [Halomonas heilongjiangensis]
MPTTYKNPVYPYRRPPELDRTDVRHCPVVIVGAGPTGLAAAIDLAQQGIDSVVLDDNNTVSVGSRAICFAKRTLEILDRLGCAQPMLDKGVTWQRGRVFFQEREIYEFDLLPEDGHRVPAFINLQQYYFEEYLVDRAGELAERIDLRWKHRVTSVDSQPDRTLVAVTTEDGDYRLSCDYLLVADGANSKIRDMLHLESKGQVFQDHFLIADVIMKADFPTERWFWFDPPFHPGQSVLLHKQPDNVWRIDFQLGWDADPEEEKKEENIRPRVQAMLGEEVEFELEWASVYTFRCRMMDDFIHNRVVFMGDAAHQVSPFGARGANGAIQSTDNLVWKLARVLKGQAPEALLATYNTERQQGAKENILNSTRATDFITPKSRISRLFRDTTLELAEHYPFARRLVNSGRLSLPCRYDGSPLNGPGAEGLPRELRPGSPARDAPIRLAGEDAWLLNRLGDRFVLLLDGRVDTAEAEALSTDLAGLLDRRADLDLLIVGPTPHALTQLPRSVVIEDAVGLVGERYGLRAGAGYLIRPDQHVTARWAEVTAEAVGDAVDHALGAHLDTLRDSRLDTNSNTPGGHHASA